MNKPTTAVSKTVSWVAKRGLGYLIGIACLIWVFHDVQRARILEHLRGVRWAWVASAVFMDVFGYLCQGWRWQLLLRPIGYLPVLQTTQGIYVGLFVNEILPMRVGEIARAYLVSRWLRVEFVRLIPSMAVERFFDGVWLAVGIGLAAIFVPLPRSLLKAADALGILVLIAAALLVFVVFRTRDPASEALPESKTGAPRGWLRSSVRRLAHDLRSIGTSRLFYFAFALSLVFMLLEALAFWFVMRAYGLRQSFGVGLVVFLIVHLGTALPNAPANVGTYQFFTVVGLTLFGVDKTLASAFSLAVFLILTVPLWAIGLVALSRTGRTLHSLRVEIDRAMLRQK